MLFFNIFQISFVLYLQLNGIYFDKILIFVYYPNCRNRGMPRKITKLTQK